MADCIFCKIINKEIPSEIVYEDEDVIAFKDINPKAPVHILLIPKGSYISIDDFGANASAQEIKGFYAALSKIVEEKGIAQSGFRSIANTGDDGGQEVPHFHVHILGGKPIGAIIS